MPDVPSGVHPRPRPASPDTGPEGLASEGAGDRAVEMRILRCCARRELSPEQSDELRSLLADVIDWGGLFELAGRHKMLPLLWWHVKQHAALVEPAWAARLQWQFQQNASRMLRLTAELLRLIELFDSHGVLAVAYKGPALGAYLYGSLALRQSGDLDLLVRRQDVARARALLLESGYRPRRALSEGGTEFMRRSRYAEEFDRDGVHLELHWAFTNGDVDLALDLDELAPRLFQVSLGPRTIPIFGVADHLLILCVHGSKHRWDRIEWLCGVAELLRAHGTEIAWDVVHDRARRLGVDRMLLLGVLLAHELLDAPVPPPTLERARGVGAVVELAGLVPALFTAPPVDVEQGSSLETDLFRLRLRERPRDRLRFVWYRLTTPSRPESWSAVGIGGLWLPVHGFLRPLRLLSKLPAAIGRHRRAAGTRS